MRLVRAIGLVTVALLGTPACYRTISDAPSGTPPLVISLPPDPYAITDPVPVEATWQAGCVEKMYWFEVSTSKDPYGHEELDPKVTKTTNNIVCKGQDFTAKATCVPGPCTVYTGARGESRTLSVVFGATGTHAMTLVIDNGSIRKAWTTDVEVVAVDAIRLSCYAWEDEVKVRCDKRRLEGSSFVIEASAYAQGRWVRMVKPTLTLDGQDMTSPVSPGLGDHHVQARYDGITADLYLTIDSPPSPSPS